MDKRSLSDRDICTKFITPAVRNAGWDEMVQIREEVNFTKGRIIVRGKLVTRGQAKRADYKFYYNNGRIFETIQHSNEAGLTNSAARLLPEGTVCFSRTASFGYVVILGRPMATSQDFANWVPTRAISSEWLQLAMIAEKPSIPRFSKSAVHQSIYNPAWSSLPVALPPLAEQHRIVVKVDALMALCDRLEAALAIADTTRARLIEALLLKALDPADGTFDEEVQTVEDADFETEGV